MVTRLLAVTVILVSALAYAGDDRAAMFRNECGVLAEKAGPEAMTVKGSDGWLFLKNELRHVAAGRFWGEYALKASTASLDEKKDPLPAILDFKKQLDQMGISLMLVPVPPKALIYPDKLSAGINADENGAVPRLDEYHREFYSLLSGQGVEVVDLFEVLSERTGGLMYCKSDTHWSGAACAKVAKLLADRIMKMDWYEGVQKAGFDSEEKEIEIAGDLGAGLPEGDPARREKLSLRIIRMEGNFAAEDPGSPVLLMADSHGLVFSEGGDMHTMGGGIFDQLAYELKFRPSLIAVRGSGATPSRMSLFRKGKADPEYLNSKKLVIWLFTAREFTETQGWSKLPVRK